MDAMKHWANLSIVVAAAVAALLPWPPSGVERWYSTAVYPALQRPLTSLSNLVPVALADIAIAVLVIGWIVALAGDIRRTPRPRWRSVAGRLTVRTAVIAAALYLAFLALWGLNYQRLPLERKLAFDVRSVTTNAAESAAMVAVSRLNALHGPARAAAWPERNSIDPSLARAFSDAVRDLGGSGRTVPGRPKHTLLNFYFRPAGVDGLTDPFFLETLVARELLPFERPFVVAHEWSHLAGFADEGEANFLGWLTCARADPAGQYSGWLFLYGQLVRDLPREERVGVVAALSAGPRQDLRAVAARLARDVRPQVAAAGWTVYDKYLKANRVEAGTASYEQVVRLVLGTEIGRQTVR